jgi:deazaflavin-dependent oxidoreductase (nitroreductase family)
MPFNPDERKAALQLSSGGRPWIILLRGHWGMAIDRFIVRLTGLSPVTFQYGLARGDGYQPTLVLTVIGKMSGRLLSHAMTYYVDAGRLVVVGTRGGGPHDPDWVWNLRANPTAWATVQRRSREVTALIAEGEERARLYGAIAAARPYVARSQARAAGFGRQLPLIILTSRDGRPLA